MHVGVHVPAMQVLPAPQTRPHPPQLFGSLSGSTHVIPHMIRGGTHVVPPHTPPVHVWPSAHTWPQAPQLRGSVSRFAHPIPQRDCGGMQIDPQPPRMHSSPAPQR
jgi:hypothetical protein